MQIAGWATILTSVAAFPVAALRQQDKHLSAVPNLAVGNSLSRLQERTDLGQSEHESTPSLDSQAGEKRTSSRE
ncbi:unnamed protein product [Lampetra planeri]